MIKVIFVKNGEPLCGRTWPAVPRSGEAFHHDGKDYQVQNVTWDDGAGIKPTAYVYVIEAERYEAWLTGRKD